MRFITASQIFNGKEFLLPHSTLVLSNDGEIKDIIYTSDIAPDQIEHFDGIITPGFINTHCHLELSHLKDKINRGKGIVNFGLEIIKSRNELPESVQLEQMLEADKAMYEQGIVAVGDISNSNLSIAAKQQSKLYYHTFVELIALNPERAQLTFDNGKSLMRDFHSKKLAASLAPHAPYTASLKLIKLITDSCFDTHQPTSIHNQESLAENDFFRTKTGNYLRLYNTLNIPIDYFKTSGKSSIQTIINSFNKNINTLLVHNTFSSNEDIIDAQKLHSHLYWCLCPNANLYIEGILPRVQLLLNNNCKLTIGTDSLASNSNLSVIDEINTLRNYQPHIPFKKLLQAATYNGAQFLGIQDKFGLIEKNKKPGINLLVDEDNKITVKKLS